MINPIPQNVDCRIANPELWKVFSEQFASCNRLRPTASWTEEQVIQWLDFNAPETVKKLREAEEQKCIRAV